MLTWKQVEEAVEGAIEMEQMIDAPANLTKSDMGIGDGDWSTSESLLLVQVLATRFGIDSGTVFDVWLTQVDTEASFCSRDGLTLYARVVPGRQTVLAVGSPGYDFGE